MVDKNELIKGFKALRKKTKLTQKDFAKKYDIPLRTVENWESGATTIKPYTYEWLKEHIEREYDDEK